MNVASALEPLASATRSTVGQAWPLAQPCVGGGRTGLGGRGCSEWRTCTELTLSRLHQRYLRVALLIVDELGFVPFERTGGELLL